MYIYIYIYIYIYLNIHAYLLMQKVFLSMISMKTGMEEDVYQVCTDLESPTDALDAPSQDSVYLMVSFYSCNACSSFASLHCCVSCYNYKDWWEPSGTFVNIFTHSLTA